MKFPQNLSNKLASRSAAHAFRKLQPAHNLLDFSSNDYLGFAKSKTIFENTNEYLTENNIHHNGSTGSRLLSGNHAIYDETEKYIAKFHEAETALIFNSGYDANIGFFQSVPQRCDLVLYDSLCHASIRDGISASMAKSYKFEHNDYEDLEKLLEKQKSNFENIYIVTEAVFSMDGDCPNVEILVALAEKFQCLLVIDEAHALGVFGNSETAGGEGFVQMLSLQNKFFARIVTFGKGLGCHGAAILGSQELRDYLVNFARSFIYTTALSPHAVATILMAYKQLNASPNEIRLLQENIKFFNQQKVLLSLKPLFVRSKSAIQSAIIPGNERVKKIAIALTANGFDVKPILSPTVPAGQERLRFCLHSYNSTSDIANVLKHLFEKL